MIEKPSLRGLTTLYEFRKVGLGVEKNMPTGTVKWFNNAKGYGFILPDNGADDLFAHFSAISMEGYKTLRAGEAVSFDIESGDKGHHAVNIISQASTASEQHAVPSEQGEASVSEPNAAEMNSPP